MNLFYVNPRTLIHLLLWTVPLALILALAGACSPSPRAAALTAALSAVETPWLRRTITQGSTTGVFRGADGVDVRQDDTGLHVATAWEEGGMVTIATLPAAGAEWVTQIVSMAVPAVEDAKIGAWCGSPGALDVASASDAGARLYLSCQNTDGSWSTTTLTGSLGHGHWMQIAAGDVDGDGLVDIIAGGRTAGALVAWFRNPGPETARDGAAWILNPITAAGWTMSLLGMDVDGDGDTDVVLSDRASYKDAAGVIRWDLYGARWIENLGSGASWANHQTERAGNCTPLCTPGDEMMMALADLNGDGLLDVVDGQSSTGHVNRLSILINPGWFTPAPWNATVIPSGSINNGQGHYAALAVGDINRDGILDLVVSTWEVNVLPTSPLIGVYWLQGSAGGDWTSHDISGPAGSKFDNVVLWDVDGDGDLDVIDSEQVDNLGVIWWENATVTL